MICKKIINNGIRVCRSCRWNISIVYTLNLKFVCTLVGRGIYTCGEALLLLLLMIEIFQIIELVGLVRLCHNGTHICRSPDLIGLQIEKNGFTRRLLYCIVERTSVCAVKTWLFSLSMAQFFHTVRARSPNSNMFHMCSLSVNKQHFGSKDTCSE